MLRFAKPRYRVVYPGNWRTVSPQPDILIQTRRPSGDDELCILTLDEFKRAGASRATALRSIPATRYSNGLGGKVQRSLADGDYVICLRNRHDGKVLCVSGIRVDARLGRWAECFDRLIKRRMLLRPAEALPRYERATQAPLFSIVTTVFDTEPAYLEELGHAIADQRCDDFEWLLLDNGSRGTATIEEVKRLAHSDARVRRYRVDRNLHIIGGNRYLLERARGRYVVPVDSDDVLYPDSLALLARECLSAAPADLFYSDEHKVGPLGEPIELIWRPAWSNLYAMATCPAAHLMAYRRTLGLVAGVYSGDYARGSHDWDTILRLVDAGARPERVQEVLYGWRMHPESSSLDTRAKRYLDDSQKNVLRESLRRRGLERHFTIQYARGAMGHYHLARRRRAPREFAVDFVLREPWENSLDNLSHNLRWLSYPNAQVRVLQIGPAETSTSSAIKRLRSRVSQWIVLEDEGRLGAIASEAPGNVFAKAIVDCRLRLDDRDWAWDAIGALELDRGTGIVTGPIVSDGAGIVSIGYVAGLNGFFGTPLPGESLDAVRGTTGYIRRSVTAAHSGFVVIRAGVTARCGNLLSIDRNDALYGIEFCLRCQRSGILTAYTPRMRATTSMRFMEPVGASDPALRDSIAAQYGDQPIVDPYYGRYLIADSHRYAEIDPCCDG